MAKGKVTVELKEKLKGIFIEVVKSHIPEYWAEGPPTTLTLGRRVRGATVPQPPRRNLLKECEQFVAHNEDKFEENKGNPSFCSALGFAFSRLCRYEDAIKYFKRVLDLVKYDANSMVQLAYCHIGLGEDDEAVKWLLKARETRTSNLTISAGLAFVQAWLNKLDEAEKYLNELQRRGISVKGVDEAQKLIRDARVA